MTLKDLKLEELKAERPDLYAAALAEGEAKAAAAAKKLAEQAAAASAGPLEAKLAEATASFQRQLDEIKAASAATLKTLQEKAEAAEKLAEEILLAAKNEGSAIKRRHDMHRMAEANKAFAHFAW